MTQAEFLAAMMLGAREAQAAGAPIHPQGAAAHAANETGYGSSALGKAPHHNLFGVKATGQHTPYWTGGSVRMQTWEVIDGRDHRVDADFRTYRTYADAFGDYGDIIRRVYPHAATAQRDVVFLAGLFLTGPRRWATDPRAFDKAARILAQHSDVLYDAEANVDGEPHDASVVVLEGFPLAHRWATLVREPVALRGAFKWRARGEKLDVRAVRE